MVTKTAILAVKVVSDVSSGQRGLDNYRGSVDRVGTSILSVDGIARDGIRALFDYAKAAADQASQAEQAAGAVEAVFKESVAQIEAASAAASTAVGLSESDYEQLASVLGAQLKNMGQSVEDAAGQTIDLIGLGADLAAQFGGPTSQAVEALSSLLRGERDPIERYGVSIKQAAIDAKLAEQGLSDLTGEARTAAEYQATLALLTEQTADVTGRFAEESNSAAGAAQIANAEWENAQATLGEKLLPYMTQAAIIAAEFSVWLADNADWVAVVAGTLGILAAALVVLTIAQWAYNVALTANPIGVVIVAVGALIAIIALLIANWDTVAKFVQEVIDNWIQWIMDLLIWLNLDDEAVAIVRAFAAVGDFIAGVWNNAIAGVQGFIGWVQTAIDWVARLASGQMVAEFFGFGSGGAPAVHTSWDAGPDPEWPDDGTGAWMSSPVLGNHVAPRLVTNITNVNLHGAILDPQGVTKAIRTAERTADRSTGKVGVGA